MTFKRLSALTKLVRKYECHKMPDENVVILISFDQLSELRAMCLKSVTTKNYQEHFIGCKLIMVHDEHDYLAVAYETHGCIYNKQEV